MADAGEVTLDVRDGTSDLGALLEEGFRLEARPWKLAAGSAIRSAPTNVRFYTEGARWAAETGLLRLMFLRVDGRALAFGYCLRQDDTLWFLKLGMDDASAKLGPGMVLTHHLVDHVLRGPGAGAAGPARGLRVVQGRPRQRHPRAGPPPGLRPPADRRRPAAPPW